MRKFIIVLLALGLTASVPTFAGGGEGPAPSIQVLETAADALVRLKEKLDRLYGGKRSGIARRLGGANPRALETQRTRLVAEIAKAEAALARLEADWLAQNRSQ